MVLENFHGQLFCERQENFFMFFRCEWMRFVNWGASVIPRFDERLARLNLKCSPKIEKIYK